MVACTGWVALFPFLFIFKSLIGLGMNNSALRHDNPQHGRRGAVLCRRVVLTLLQKLWVGVLPAPWYLPHISA